MTDSELIEIRTAINAAKQYSEDKPNGRYERLLIAVLPILECVENNWHHIKARIWTTDNWLSSQIHDDYKLALSIARAINKKK